MHSDPLRPLAGPNTLFPDTMSAQARLTEVGRILAAAVARIQAEKSSPLSAEIRDRFVDFTPKRSGIRRRTRIRIGGET